jgi:hypothetical protein
VRIAETFDVDAARQASFGAYVHSERTQASSNASALVRRPTK